MLGSTIVVLYRHSSILIHGMALDGRTGTNLPFFFYLEFLTVPNDKFQGLSAVERRLIYGLKAGM
jgi:hypothetical protein